MTLRPASAPPSGKVTLLILGAGWTYQFLESVLRKTPKITNAATTTTGHGNTIPFKFDPESDDVEPFNLLPSAEYVLITFPLKGQGPSRKLVSLYAETHPSVTSKWIQLGSTGIYTLNDWNDSNSPIEGSNERGVAEDELISLGGCVLNLAGLYGAARQPRNWISRVAKTKEQLAGKGALHLIHGLDVARGVVSVVSKDLEGEGSELFRRRWIVADCVSYDWWSLAWDIDGDAAEKDGESRREGSRIYRRWIFELMQENNVKGLPRSMETLGRKLDAREFWEAVGILPERSLSRNGDND